MNRDPQKYGESTLIAIGVILVCCLLSVAVLERTSAQSSSKIIRPRMLIGEHDPLTGFAVLRARYSAGARPPDAIDGWALTYLLINDEAYAKKAVEEIARTHPPELVGSRTYPEYVKWSLAFDWLYNYPGFDTQLKDRVAAELLKAAEQMLADQSLKEVQLAMYHNYPVRYLTLAIFALTAIEGHPSVESRAAPLRVHARAVLDHILDLTDFITPDGGYHESMDYQRITYAPLAMMAELLRTTENSDPSRRYSVFHHYTDTYLYKVLPDGTTARDDDNEFPYLQWEDNIVMGYAINRFKDPYAAWMLRESGWPAQKNWRIPITQFLWDDPDVKPRNPAISTEAEISRHYLFRGVGHLVMRDGFGPASTWIQFNSGPYLAKHDHLDQNHFVIYHKGYLATESGADYTDTESPHYLNYYRRTIAHNSMLVYKTGEKFFWAENLRLLRMMVDNGWTLLVIGIQFAAAKTLIERVIYGTQAEWKRRIMWLGSITTLAATRQRPINLPRWNGTRARSCTRPAPTCWSFSIAFGVLTRDTRKCGCCMA